MTRFSGHSLIDRKAYFLVFKKNIEVTFVNKIIKDSDIQVYSISSVDCIEKSPFITIYSIFTFPYPIPLPSDKELSNNNNKKSGIFGYNFSFTLSKAVVLLFLFLLSENCAPNKTDNFLVVLKWRVELNVILYKEMPFILLPYFESLKSIQLL